MDTQFEQELEPTRNIGRDSILTGPDFEVPDDRPDSMAEYVTELVGRWRDGEYIEVDRQGRTLTRSYIALFQRAQQLAAVVESRRTGDSDFFVVLCFESVLDFIPAAWACLLSGVNYIPWPIDALSRNKDEFIKELQSLLLQFKHPMVLTEAPLRKMLCDQYGCIPEQQVIATPAIPNPPSFNFYINHKSRARQSKLLIATSGTTGDPKLAVLEDNVIMNRLYEGFDSKNRLAMHCLAHHSITGIRVLIPRGPRVVYMQPARIISSPMNWLRIVQEYRVTSVGITPYMASVLTKAMEARAPDYDVSSVTGIGFGAEEIAPSVIQRFIEALRALGLGGAQLSFTYGLTETGPVYQTKLEDRELLSASGGDKDLPGRGHCVQGWSLRIADDSGEVVPEGNTGRIQVFSNSKLFTGYYNDPRTNARSFTPDGWFNTGDLGRIEHGCLVIAGREKSTIIVNGRKITCEQVEALLRDVDELNSLRIIAAPLRSERYATDELVVFCVAESFEQKALSSIATKIAHVAAELAGIAVKHVVPVNANEVQRTVTLKVQRDAMVQRYREHAWPNLLDRTVSSEKNHGQSPASDVRRAWMEALELRGIPSMDDNFFCLGGDSLAAARLLADIEEIFGVTLSIESFFEQPTVANMVDLILARRSAGIHDSAVDSAGNMRDGSNLLRALEVYVGSWQGERLFADSMVVGKNTRGTRPPIFWVFQAYRELKALADALGPDQPIYGMRSGVEIMPVKEYRLDTLQTVVNRYLWEILALTGGGVYALGGNCQGAILALLLGQRLEQIECNPGLLMLMEWSFSYGGYDSPVLLLHGEDSHTANLYSVGSPQRLSLERDFPDHIVVSIPGGHGQFFDARNIASLAAAIQGQCSELVTPRVEGRRRWLLRMLPRVLSRSLASGFRRR